MRATVTAIEFAEAMKKVSGICKKSPIPVLNQVCVEFTGNTCRLTATDLAVWLSAEITACGNAFTFCFGNVAAVTRACQYYSGVLELELLDDGEDKRICMSCEDKESVFPVFSAELFPVRSTEEATEHYKTNAKELLNRVKSIQYAADVHDDKRGLNGICFEKDRLWCIDGYRLAISRSDTLQIEKPFVLPVSAMQYLKLLGDSMITIGVGSKYAVISSDNLKLLIRRIENFTLINIEKTVPSTFTEQYQVNVPQFQKAVTYLLECAVGMDRPYAVFDYGRIILHRKDSEHSAKLDVQGDCDCQYGFDLRYMKDALGQFEKEQTVTVSIGGEYAPILLTGNEGGTAMILPVRMRNEWRRAA